MARNKKQNQSEKTTRKKVNSKKTKQKQGPEVKTQQIKLAVGVFLSLLALFLLFAFSSYFMHVNADQSKLQISWGELVSDSSIRVENIMGKIGAWLADVLMNRAFGIASYIFLYIITISTFVLWGRPIKNFERKVFNAVLSILWLSIFLGFIFESKYESWSLYPGGLYGYHIAHWLTSMTGRIGTFLILLASLAIYVILSFEGLLKAFSKELKPEQPEGDALIADDKLKDEQELNEPKDQAPIDVQDELPEENEPDIKEEIEIIPTINEDDIQKEMDLSDDEISIERLENANPNDPEMTIEKKEQEEEEIENKPLEDYDPKLDLSHYTYPDIQLLVDHKFGQTEVTDEELRNNKNRIVETLRNFKIEITKIKATIGPTVTLYEIVPAQGVRISKIKNLEDDIALSLAALGIRIIAPIPGRGTIGIEVPNQNPQVVSMRSIIASKKFQESKSELPVAMGRTISNETFVFDLAKMPHMLVAGATGQGKSVGLNAIITSLLYKKHPSQLKFVFIDPKKVELNLYSVIENHFLAKLPDEEEPIITDVDKVKNTLNSVNVEMDSRYDLLKKAHARNIKEYNQKFIQRKLNPEKGHRYLPYIVVVVDEFADLIMTAGKEIELPIARIAQLARAVGIHMIIATQRPSTNIITGVIKANFPTRIAFKVASMIDSRTILDSPGANQLIGKGDMLFSAGSTLVRLQCAFVDTPEVEAVCEHIANQQGYPTAFILPEYVGEGSDTPGTVDLNQRDEFFDDAARIVVMNQQGSTSMIQRKFSIGYNRAGRIMDQLEAAGVVGASEGSKARKVLIPDEYSLEQLLNNLN